MRQLNYSIAALTFLVVTMLIAGCGKGSEEKIMGIWVSDGLEQAELEFFEDNTFLRKKGRREIKGSWTILSDGRLKMTADKLGQNKVIVGDFEVKGDKMILNPRSGEKERYTRKKSPEEKILGVWVPSLGVSIMEKELEFFEDNTFLRKKGRREIKGSWTILSDGRLKMTADKQGQNKVTVSEFEIKGGEMILNPRSGEKERYIRKRLKPQL